MDGHKQAASGIRTTGPSVLSSRLHAMFWTAQLQFKALTQLSELVSCHDWAAHSPLFQPLALQTFAQALPLARRVSPFSPTQVQPALWGSGQILLLYESWALPGHVSIRREMVVWQLGTTLSSREGEHHSRCVWLRDRDGESDLLYCLARLHFPPIACLWHAPLCFPQSHVRIT